MFPNGRRFAVSDQPGYGVSCGATGVFVAAVPLLEPCHNCGGFRKWRPRSLDEINRDLSRRYGAPVDFGAKMQGLTAIAGALDRGDLLHAHIATLHLEIPDPPPLAKRTQSATELVALAKELQASGMLRRDWDPSKHPRWPAGSPDSTGGRFAPGDASSYAAPEDESKRKRRYRTAQLTPTIPIPFEAITPRGVIPWPSEIAPPLAIYPRRELVNPYPDDPECAREWAEAFKFCDDLKKRRLLGRTVIADSEVCMSALWAKSPAVAAATPAHSRQRQEKSMTQSTSVKEPTTPKKSKHYTSFFDPTRNAFLKSSTAGSTRTH